MLFMKKLIVAFSAALFLSPLAFAQTKKFGIGAILGDPTAISAKYFLNNSMALDGAISYSHHELLLLGDYLKHFPGRMGNQNDFVARLTPFIGVGPVVAIGDSDKNHHFLDDDDDFGFGVRVPLGLEWMAPEIPLGISFELAPGLQIVDETDAFIQGGLAFRYYF